MIIFFGPQGSGKGTQAEILAERNGWRWLSAGQILRDATDPEVHRRQETGELIDDALTSRLLDAALTSVDPKINIILDGYPRNATQAQWLNDNLPKHGRQIDCVIEIDIPKEESIKRMLNRGRTDDTVEAIERRLEIYHSETKPIIDFYLMHKVPCTRVDGLGSVEEVQSRIQDAVNACKPK